MPPRTPGGEIAAKRDFMRKTGSAGILKSKPGARSRGGQTAKQRSAANRATRREARALQARLTAAGRPKEAKRAARNLRRRAR